MIKLKGVPDEFPMDEPGSSYPHPLVNNATLDLVVGDIQCAVAREESSLPSGGRNFPLEPGTSSPSMADIDGLRTLLR